MIGDQSVDFQSSVSVLSKFFHYWKYRYCFENSGFPGGVLHPRNPRNPRFVIWLLNALHS